MTPTTEHHELADAPFRLGDWLVEPRLNRLTRGDESIQIELKMMDVLVCLAGHAGELVARQELIDTVWAIEFITEKTLTRAVAELRRTLGDDAKEPTYIETIHRKGYRLIAAVETVRKPSGTVIPFSGAHTATDDRNPYPGLAAFTEVDAELFFGREAEVSRLWRTITTRRLLAVIGPSGVGKTSFLRAGLIPAAPEGWGILICTPGEAPFAALARALAPEFEGDLEAISKLVGISEPSAAAAVVSRWRERYDRALLIVDQFEELFTLNASETQAGFSELIGRLARDADVHVLLSLRDDFLYRCHDHEALLPVFSELMPLKAPGRDDLRRALVEPAARHGYSFEDDALSDEMLEAVTGERGALPLLAFAVARLWEKRDRERKLLTRQAYSDIGGVGGALAHHAEATIDRIGTDRLSIVRELFRNLVTAEGTRAAREWNDLLSIFSDSRGESPSESPAAVLSALIDARLLTSYDVTEEDREPTRRVEIIHESLLANWPRLVRWQTQDADSAQLRDQLRQAARTWNEHDRTDDLLWTGSAYREFSVWRERYPGGLTEVEEGFAGSMARHAKRKMIRRRIVAAAALLILASVAIVMTDLWRRSTLQERRAEAANLVSLGQLELESYPSATVAYAISSLELAESPGARQLAQAALWKGPTALVVNEESSWNAEFTPDGRFLVQSGDGTGRLRLIKADGTSQLLKSRHESTRNNIWMGLEIAVFGTSGFFDKPKLPLIGLWSGADGRMLGEAMYEAPAQLLDVAVNAPQQRMVYLVLEGDLGSIDTLGFDGTRERLGSPDFGFNTTEDWFRRTDLERRTGRWLGAVVDNEVLVIEIGAHGLSKPRRLGRYEGSVTDVRFDPLGRFFATGDMDGHIRLWDTKGASRPIILNGPPGAAPYFTADGSLLEAWVVENGEETSWIWSLGSDPPRLLRPFALGQAGIGGSYLDSVGWQIVKVGPDARTRLWPMAAPADADPVFLLRGDVEIVWASSFHPEGIWLATADKLGAALWPLSRPYPAVIRRHDKEVMDLLFGPEGRWLVSSSMDHTVRLWPLEGDVLLPGRILLEDPGVQMYDLARTPNGEQLLVGTGWSGVRLFSLSGEESGNAPDIGPSVFGATISPDGRLGAGVLDNQTPEERIFVWDLASGEEVKVLHPEGRGVFSVHFTDDGHLLSSSKIGLRKWDLLTGGSELLYEGNLYLFEAVADGKEAIVIDGDYRDASAPKRAVFLELETGETRTLTTHGARVNAVALDTQRNIVVTGGSDGAVRVGPITGEEPHLLLGHEGRVYAVAIDPLGRWIASGGADNTVRLWPMPDLSEPPLHTLPSDELIAKLKTLTNLRAVRDEESSTGWKIEVGPFPGWETVPTW